MTWHGTRSTRTDPKYRTKQHRDLRQHYVDRINAGEALPCTAADCLFNGDPIVNTNGNDPDGLHLGHADDGITYAGPQHRLCNLRDGAVRGSARSHGKSGRADGWAL